MGWGNGVSDDLERPPSNIPAEQYVLSSMLLSIDAVRAVYGKLRPVDFYMPAHQRIFEAILAVWDRGAPVDAVTVFTELGAAGLRQIGGAPYLHSILEAAPTAVNADHYASIVREQATKRRMVEVGHRIAQRAAEDVDPSELLAWAARQVEGVADVRTDVGHLTRPLSELMDAEDREIDWALPGYLERGDRLVLTGFGGAGKSTLLKQLFVCAAAGLDPFTYDRIDPLRVSVIDKENPDPKTRRSYLGLLHQARFSTKGEFDIDRIRVGWKGGRLDLLNAGDAMSLLRTIEKDKPDLCYVGPYYKIHSGDPDKEDTVRRVTAVLDRIVDMGVAVMIEAHPNKAAKSGGAMSPSGSDAWTWWPEYGLGLRLDPDPELTYRKAALERWRGDRDIDNAWPETLVGGTMFPWLDGGPA